LKTPGNDIIPRIRSGDQSVFEALFRDYYARLCGYALKFVADTDQAEEIVQDLFCNLWDKKESRDIMTSVEAYLFRAVRNACFNHLKHLKIRYRHTESVKETAPAVSESVHESLEFLELAEMIEKAVEGMPPERKKIYILSRQEGLKYKDIAEKLNISVKTVENQMGKALKYLREHLSQYLVIMALIAIIIRLLLFK
jgi:RNA polymerase sigma-70 factor (ECF subfamily)